MNIPHIKTIKDLHNLHIQRSWRAKRTLRSDFVTSEAFGFRISPISAPACETFDSHQFVKNPLAQNSKDLPCRSLENEREMMDQRNKVLLFLLFLFLSFF